jgi:hypothetical protein
LNQRGWKENEQILEEITDLPSRNLKQAEGH